MAGYRRDRRRDSNTVFWWVGSVGCGGVGSIWWALCVVVGDVGVLGNGWNALPRRLPRRYPANPPRVSYPAAAGGGIDPSPGSGAVGRGPGRQKGARI